MSVASVRGDVTTLNVLAETKHGNSNQVLFVAAHLDSIQVGPGVNDDGSGSMVTLELAHAFHRSGLDKKTHMKVRFAWWCAEETGLQGSRFHVNDLAENQPSELAKIKLNIDTDMVASPNFVRGVWDGHGLERQPKYKNITVAAGVIEDVFRKWFKKEGLPTVPFEFNGRSDFVAFMDHGIMFLYFSRLASFLNPIHKEFLLAE